MALYHPGDLVFGKLLGFPPWPARIEAPKAGQNIPSNEYPVFFFGTYKSAIVHTKDIFPYGDFKETYGKPQKRQLFNEALREIENNPTVQSLTPVDDQSETSEINFVGEEMEEVIKKTEDTKFKPKLRPKRKRTEPERSRSGRMIKRKKFSSDSEMSDYSEVEIIDEKQNKYPGDKRKSESDSEDRESPQSERESGVDLEEELLAIEVEKSEKKKGIKNNSKTKTNNKSKLKEKEETKHYEIKVDEQLEEPENDDEIISKLFEIDKRIRRNLSFSNLDVQASLDAMSELQTMPLNTVILKRCPDVLVTLKKCRKFTKSESVRQKAEFLYNKFKINFLGLDKDNTSMSEKENEELQSIISDIGTENIIRELPQNVNDYREGSERKISVTVNHQHQNLNDRVSQEGSERNISVTVNHQHQKVNDDRNAHNRLERNNGKSSIDPSADIVALLSSSVAMMKSLQNKKETMEDAFGNFVAHQIKTFSDPVLKDRVMSRIMSVIMEEKYE